MKTIGISTEFIKLDSFLKFCGAVSTGGEAKAAIMEGQALVNGQPCYMRGKKLVAGDQVSFLGDEYTVANQDPQDMA